MYFIENFVIWSTYPDSDTELKTVIIWDQFGHNEQQKMGVHWQMKNPTDSLKQYFSDCYVHYPELSFTSALWPR